MLLKVLGKLTVRGTKATEYIGNLAALHIKVALETASSFSSSLVVLE
jgi:hypothetical protein